MNNVRRNAIVLRGTAPRIEADAASLNIIVAHHDNTLVGSNISSNIDYNDNNNTASFVFSRGGNVTYLLESQSNDGVHVCVTDLKSSELGPTTWPRADPYMSFRTTYDQEVMRINAGGLKCTTFNADVYASLSSSFNSANVFRPPSEYALSEAYITLSNMVVKRTVSLSSNAVLDDLSLVDSYISESVLEAPTASALRGAYYSLSNQMALNFAHQAIAMKLDSNLLEAASSIPPFLPTDMWLTSTDVQQRFRFDNDGSTWIATSSNFTFFDNVMQRQIATLSSDGSLVLRKDANFCGDLTVEGGVSLGSDVVITHDGSNVGVNMPHGTVPTYTLHVNGSVFSTQQMFALSDRRVKTDIKRIDDPLDIVEAINGYTFKMNGKACVGVIAQEVNTVMPEAVSMVNNGKDDLMSVSYDGLVGVLFEAVKKLSLDVQELRCQILSQDSTTLSQDSTTLSQDSTTLSHDCTKPALMFVA
eukprot:gene8390-18306_t